MFLIIELEKPDQYTSTVPMYWYSTIQFMLVVFPPKAGVTFKNLKCTFYEIKPFC